MKSPQYLFLLGDKVSGVMFLKYREKTFYQGLKLAKFIFVLFLLWGCVAGEGGKKTATCTNGQSFDSVSRKCSGAQVLPEAPIGVTRELSVLEGSGETTVELRYTDSQNDLATSCKAYTNGPGLIRDLYYQGVRIRSKDDNKSPERIRVRFIEQPGTPSVLTILSGGFINIYVYIPASGADANSIATRINSSAGTYVEAIALELTNVFADGQTYTISELECGCFGGRCTTTIEPAEFYNGTTEFYYTITDKDGTSSPRLVLVNVTSFNDPPVILPTGTFAYDPGVAARPTELYDDFSNLGLENPTINVAANYTITDVESDPTSFVCTRAPAFDITGKCNLTSDGVLTYRTTSHINSDSIRFVIVDSKGAQSEEVEFQFAVEPVNDPPIGLTTNAPSVTEEDDGIVVELDYSDEENQTVNACLITGVNKMWPTSACLCSGTPRVCSATFRTWPDENGTGTFSYVIFDGSTPTTPGTPGYPVAKTVSIAINNQNDGPIIFPTANGGNTIEFAESETFDSADAIGAPYKFTLDGGLDQDGNTIFWEFDTVNSTSFKGTLSGCLPAIGNTLPECTYTPSNGNLANSSSLITPTISNDVENIYYPRVRIDTGIFYATSLGEGMNGLKIELVQINPPPSCQVQRLTPMGRRLRYSMRAVP
jgi:hypothetical protein